MLNSFMHLANDLDDVYEWVMKELTRLHNAIRGTHFHADVIQILVAYDPEHPIF
jgi:hypothetical protein